MANIKLYICFSLQVSVGTLLAFTMVAISVLILRYVPPDEVPLPPSLQESIDSVSLRFSRSSKVVHGEHTKVRVGTSKENREVLLDKGKSSVGYPLLEEKVTQCKFMT